MADVTNINQDSHCNSSLHTFIRCYSQILVQSSIYAVMGNYSLLLNLL